MEILLICIIGFLLLVIFAGINRDNQRKKELQEIINDLYKIASFVDYCNDFKEDLPEHIRERYNRMKNELWK